MKTIIIGAVAAGAKAAMKLKRLLPESEITIYTQDTHVSYSSCGLPYYIKGDFDDFNYLLVKSPEEFENDGIKVFLKHRVDKIQPQYNKVLISDLDGKTSFLDTYDNLIIATGARPYIPHIANMNLKNVFVLRRIEDGINVKDAVKRSKRAVIIGSGYIGMELLEAIASNDVHVDIIEKMPNIMPNMDEDVSNLIKKELESIAQGRFEFHTGENVIEFRGDCDSVKQVVTENGKIIDTDMIVIAAGVVPNVEIAKDAGIKIGVTGAIQVDKFMRTNIKNIYACGDCAEKTMMITETPVYIPLGSYASKEGRCAAINASGQVDGFYGILGSTVTRCFDLTISMTGLTTKKALEIGKNPVSTVITKSDRVGYMPEVDNITLKLIADKSSGQLLGAQAVGSKYADKKINSLTSALTAKMTVSEFLNNDNTYSPPYSTTVDLLYNAALKLKDQIE